MAGMRQQSTPVSHNISCGYNSGWQLRAPVVLNMTEIRDQALTGYVPVKVVRLFEAAISALSGS